MPGHPDRMLYLDIKSVKLPDLEKLVREKGVEQQVIFTSEHPKLIRDWKRLVPESHTLLWNRGTEEQLDRPLRWVCTTDLLDPARYLSGGELVISGLLWRRGPEDSARFPVERVLRDL